MNSSTVAYALDRSMYDHPGKTTTVQYPKRKYRDLPALAVGDTVTIVRFDFRQDQYGLWPRVLVQTADGGQRWVDGSTVHPLDGQISGLADAIARS